MFVSANRLVRGLGVSLDKATVFAPMINVVIDRFEVNTPLRLANFLGNVAHESRRFEGLVENMNYSAKRLAQVWPRRFGRAVTEGGRVIGYDATSPNDAAYQYSGNPQRLASFVYANRMGNGPEASGDGWKYRGRGLIHVTGRDNYIRTGKELGLDLINHPETLESPLYAALSAGQFWFDRGLNQLADKDDREAICLRVNGGTNGLDEREAYTDRMLEEIRKHGDGDKT